MERQAAFVLLAFLYLASPLGAVQAVRYEGPSTVNEGQPWEITCTRPGHKVGDKFNWTRNGQPLEELSSGELTVETNQEKGISKLKTDHATELQEGNYRCTPGGNESFHLAIKSVTTIHVLTEKDTPLFIACDNRTEVPTDWYKEGVHVLEKFSGKDDIVTINSTNGYLEISKDEPAAFGNYTCNNTLTGNSSVLYRVVPKPTASLVQPSVTVVEDGNLHLICIGKHIPGIKISWTFAGKTYNNTEGRVKLSRDKERGINRAVLDVTNIQMDERGNVTCHASYDWMDNKAGHYARADILLRVKDKLAALWPFLGICAEVVVLCAIILIYEKKRNKAELEESDTDQSPDTKPTPNKDSDVRQRK